MFATSKYIRTSHIWKCLPNFLFCYSHKTFILAKLSSHYRLCWVSISSVRIFTKREF